MSKLDELNNVVSFNVELNCVIHLDQSIRIPIQTSNKSEKKEKNIGNTPSN
jgi:hypothetical protein